MGCPLLETTNCLMRGSDMIDKNINGVSEILAENLMNFVYCQLYLLTSIVLVPVIDYCSLFIHVGRLTFAVQRL